MTQEKATAITQLADAVEYIRNNDVHALAVGAIAALADVVNERDQLLSEVARLKQDLEAARAEVRNSERYQATLLNAKDGIDHEHN